jgi:REP element-mobilizing transposase RayT
VKDVHHRHALRLKGFDYTQHGAYFVTICVQNRQYAFGTIQVGVLELNAAGLMIATLWSELPHYYSEISIDHFVVMPNHFHGIIILEGGAQHNTNEGQISKISLSEVVPKFKSLTTTRYRQGVQQQGWEPALGKLWQSRYFDHIIRSEADLNRIREYIINNPAKWEFDQENVQTHR